MLIAVGIPVHDGRVYAQTVDSLLAEQMLGFSQGVHILPLWEVGGGNIGFARNQLARKFLALPEAECIVFADSDMSWPGGTLLRLAQCPEEVVGGTYRAKNPDCEQWHIGGRPEKVGDLYRIDSLPGGFIKISRSAFERIKPNTYADLSGNIVPDYFPTGFFDGVMYGEDYGFCRLYRQHGGTVWLDPSLVLRHHDGNAVYSGDPQQRLLELSEAT